MIVVTLQILIGPRQSMHSPAFTHGVGSSSRLMKYTEG